MDKKSVNHFLQDGASASIDLCRPLQEPSLNDLTLCHLFIGNCPRLIYNLAFEIPRTFERTCLSNFRMSPEI